MWSLVEKRQLCLLMDVTGNYFVSKEIMGVGGGALLQCGRGSYSHERSNGILERAAQRVYYRRGSRGQDMLLYQKLNAFVLILFGV